MLPTVEFVAKQYCSSKFTTGTKAGPQLRNGNPRQQACCLVVSQAPSGRRAMDPIFVWFGVASATGTTAISVTHDQSEFDSLGNRS